MMNIIQNIKILNTLKIINKRAQQRSFYFINPPGSILAPSDGNIEHLCAGSIPMENLSICAQAALRT